MGNTVCPGCRSWMEDCTCSGGAPFSCQWCNEGLSPDQVREGHVCTKEDVFVDDECHCGYCDPEKENEEELCECCGESDECACCEGCYTR